MKEILNYFLESTLQTKLFIFSSAFILGIIQYLLTKISFKAITILAVQVLFGFLLSALTQYNFLVHALFYFLPSLIITLLLILVNPIKKRAKQDPYAISLNTNKGKLSFNPFSGVCILGTPKAGKTASIVKPTIQQLAEKNFCGIIYDYKKFDLTKAAYYHFQDHRVVEFKSINPFELNYSYRVNPIHPDIIKHPAYAQEAAQVFIANMMGASKNNTEGKYWIDSAAGVLAAVIWRLRDDFPEFCTLPHAISIIIKKQEKELATFLEKNDQSQFLAASFFKSLVSEKQVAGILGTLASSLSKVALPEIFYLFSGNEVNLELNNPEKPTLLTISTIQQLDKTYAPALALVISMALKLMNQEGRHHSAVILDEAPTLIIPEFDRIPATARSNKIATFYIAQDMVQGEAGYGRVGSEMILATLATHMYGKVMDPATADRYSKMFGTVDKNYTSRSRKLGEWGNSSFTDSLREIRKFKPEKFHSLETGEFLGLIADGNMKEFNVKFKCYQEFPIQLPMIRNVTSSEVKETFDKIILEAMNLE